MPKATASNNLNGRAGKQNNTAVNLVPKKADVIRISELMKQVPKATKGTGGNRYQSAPDRENNTAVNFSKNKTEVIRDAGFTHKAI